MTEYEKLKQMVIVQKAMLAAIDKSLLDVQRFRHLATKHEMVSTDDDFLAKSYQVISKVKEAREALQIATRRQISKQSSKVAEAEILAAGAQELGRVLGNRVVEDPLFALAKLVETDDRSGCS